MKYMKINQTMSSIPTNILDNTTTSPKNANEKGTPKLDKIRMIELKTVRLYFLIYIRT